ncbi:hypothetical protein HDU85_007407 [Gaertneriomyces sp. JEL0708]|nr:hypothetical protein HDU85_007407 [Gaertneriomyces sp. JEL0708]
MFVSFVVLLLTATIPLSNGISVSLTPAFNTTYSHTLPAAFVSLSVEWTHVDDGIGPGPASNGGYTPFLRIGGNSATRLWWQGSKLPRLEQSAWSVNDIDLRIMEEFAARTGVKYVIGVPMLSPDPAYAVEFLSQGIHRTIAPNHIQTIEVGNEPDHYAKKGRRPATYDFPTFLTEYSTAFNAISAANRLAGYPNIEYMGPAYAYPWSEELLKPFAESNPQTRWISFHKYGERGCSIQTNPNAVTVVTLMTTPSSREFEWLDGVSDFVNGNNQLLVWGEGGSASCNGVPGVSDVFAAALWTVDMSFEMAYRNVSYAFLSGVAQSYYAPYSYDPVTKETRARPAYYGMLFVNRVLRGSDNRVFRAKTDEGLLEGEWPEAGNATKVWGVKNDRTGEWTIVVLRKDTDPFTSQQPESIELILPPGETFGCPSTAAHPNGYITRLTAPSLSSTADIRINGQTWDTPTGDPTGTYTEETVVPANGVFSITVDPFTAVALRVGCTPGMAATQYTPPPYTPFMPPTTLVPSGQQREETKQISGTVVGIGVVAGALALAAISACVVWSQNRKRGVVLPSAEHPHPYAKGNPYLYSRGTDGRA